MTEPLLRVAGLSKAFGAVVASDHVSLEIAAGEAHAVIGPNGAGKSTLIGQLAGEIAPDSGSIRFDGREIVRLPVHTRARMGLARSFQVSSIFPRLSALENVALAVLARKRHGFGLWRPARSDASLLATAGQTLAQAGLAGREAVPAASLAHGEQRQLELAMALATSPRLLLLDEPMAGMGPDDSRRMVELLANLKGRIAMLLIEHDMDAVFALAERVSVMVYGKVIATGAPAAIRADPAVRQAYLGEDEAI